MCLFQYPSMEYTQGGGLPIVSVPRGASDSSSMAADSFGLMMASQSPFDAPALSPTSPSLASNLLPGETKFMYCNKCFHVLIEVYSNACVMGY